MPPHATRTTSIAKTRGKRRTPRASRPRIAEIFRRFAAANPDPKGELEYVNPYTLLVAVVLSAQATDAGVNKATRGLFKIASTPQKMLALGLQDLQERIKTIGLYRNKAKHVIALSQQLVAQHGGEVPQDREALEALPGVGRKTANVVLNIAFGQATLAVDTHVFRVAHRLALANGKTPQAVEAELLQVIPETYLHHAHHWLILHGRYVCRARKPSCDRCMVSDLCPSDDKWFHGTPPRAVAKQKINP
jgi:endonuclease III